MLSMVTKISADSVKDLIQRVTLPLLGCSMKCLVEHHSIKASIVCWYFTCLDFQRWIVKSNFPLCKSRWSYQIHLVPGILWETWVLASWSDKLVIQFVTNRKCQEWWERRIVKLECGLLLKRSYDTGILPQLLSTWPISIMFLLASLCRFYWPE